MDLTARGAEMPREIAIAADAMAPAYSPEIDTPT